MIITQTFTMARWQIVVKTSEATKQTKTKMTTKNKQTNKQNKNNNNNNKTGGGGGGWKSKKLTEWSNDVVIIIDLRETERGRGWKHVLLRLYHKQILADYYRFTSGRFGAKKSWTIANIFLLVSKCSWSFPKRSVLIFLSLSSSLLMVSFLMLL